MPNTPLPQTKGPPPEGHHYGLTILAKTINSGIASVIGTILMYPLDLTKTRFQSQRTVEGSTPLYTSLIDALKKIQKAEGTRGFYRGCTINTILIVPEKTLKLVTNDVTRQVLANGTHVSLLVEVVAGATSGLVQCIISTPMDLIKVNLQNAGRLAAMNKSGIAAEATSSLPMIAQLVRKRGFLGFYQGFAATAGRNVAFSIVYFPSFYALKNLRADPKTGTASSAWSFVSGCIAGGCGATAATPFDVVKTRMQRLKLADCDVAYRGITDAFVQIFRTEGPLALMKGCGIRIMTIAPLFGIIQTIYFLGIGEYLVYNK